MRVGAAENTTPTANPPQAYNSRGETSTPKVQAALRFAELGCGVLPLSGKAPLGKLAPRGVNSATRDPRKIVSWLDHRPNANYGVALGRVVVLDTDTEEAEEEVRHRGEGDPFLKVRTGRGRHRYYWMPDGEEAKTLLPFPGAEIRGAGSYVVGPHCRHETGVVYAPEPSEGEGKGAPPEWLAMLMSITDDDDGDRGLAPATSSVVTDLDGPPILEGTRNSELTRCAGKLHDGSRSLPELVEALLALNEARCPSPLEAPEIKKIAESIHKRAPCSRRSSPPPPEAMGPLGDILDAWWRAIWRGPGGDSERDVLLVLILLALAHGRLLPNGGISVSVSFRELAELARVGLATAHRAFKRLRVKGWLRGGGNGPDRGSAQAAGFVLLPPPRQAEHSQPPGGASTGGVQCVPPCAPPTAPRGRHSAPGLRRTLRKKVIAVVDHLEHAGGGLEEAELAAMLGIKRARDLRRRYLAELEAAAVVECFGGKWRLTAGWRGALGVMLEHEREIEKNLHGGKTTDELQRERHLREREAYRERRKIEPDVAPKPGETRRSQERYPRRRRRAIEAAVARLFRERPEYRGRRVGQVACALTALGYLPAGFPRGPDGAPKDWEVAAVLDGEAA